MRRASVSRSFIVLNLKDYIGDFSFPVISIVSSEWTYIPGVACIIYFFHNRRIQIILSASAWPSLNSFFKPLVLVPMLLGERNDVSGEWSRGSWCAN